MHAFRWRAVLTMARFSLYKPSSVSDLLFVWREIWTACMHYRPKYGDVKPKQPTSPCRVLLLSATGGFSALKSVYGNVRHMKLCVKCQYCLHCESNHSFRWMPIALKDWTCILGGLAADVFQEKCEQNEKVLARRIWTTDLRMSIWYFQLQSSALPTELSRDALVGRKIRRHKLVPGTDMYSMSPSLYLYVQNYMQCMLWPWYWLICGLFVCLPCATTCWMERCAQ